MMMMILCSVPTWGIVAIVIVVVVVLACVGYLVRKLLSKKRHKGKDPKKGTKGAMDVKGVPMLGALSTKVRYSSHARNVARFWPLVPAAARSL